ncbi:MAG: hypothetical protein O7G30_12340, partial [Proteobacteria bacterium]|nr:hypothetical protein [Pseudomonadota bacterium]
PALSVHDWASDPGETRNLHDPANPEHRRMMERLAEYKRVLVEAHRRDSFGARDPSAERQEELLRSLGYIE